MDSKGLEALQRSIREQLLDFMSTADRTWEELVGALAGVPNPSAFDLEAEQALRVHQVNAVLLEMVVAGKVVRACPEDPRYDMARESEHPRRHIYRPPARRSPKSRTPFRRRGPVEEPAPRLM